MTSTAKTNSLCPDYSSHYQNATERFFGGRQVPEVLSADEDAAILADAEVEYHCCEGH